MTEVLLSSTVMAVIGCEKRPRPPELKAKRMAIAFKAVLNNPQFNGVPRGEWDAPLPAGSDVPEFLKCWDPFRFVDKAKVCRELIPRSIAVAEAVFGRTKDDPYKGEGAPGFPGVLFNETVDLLQDGKGFKAKAPPLRDLNPGIQDNKLKRQHHVHFPLWPDMPGAT